MDDVFLVVCPYCGEQVEIYLEPDVAGSLIQDCEVCCNPWRVRVRGRGDERWLDVAKADGMAFLREDGMVKVALGVTSIEEILRVVV